MRVYLKSGDSFRVSQEVVNKIMESVTNGDNEAVVGTDRLDKNVHLYIDVCEVAAIK